jgi:hypothetical protein
LIWLCLYTSGTLSTGALIPTVMDNLVSQEVIAANLFALSFEPGEDGSVREIVF